MANRWGKKWKQSQVLFSWAPKSLWTVTTAMKLKDARSLERCDRPRPLNPKESQLWIFIWRTDADAEAPILRPTDMKRWLTEKDWCWERLKAKEEGGRGWDVITDSMDVNLSKLQKIVKDREAWCAAVHRVTKRWTQLSDWTKLCLCSINETTKLRR